MEHLFRGGISEAAKIKHHLRHCHVPWRKWLLKLGELIWTVTVRLLEEALIDMVAKRVR